MGSTENKRPPAPFSAVEHVVHAFQGVYEHNLSLFGQSGPGVIVAFGNTSQAKYASKLINAIPGWVAEPYTNEDGHTVATVTRIWGI